MSPSIQIVSDLHIEYENNEIPNPLEYITPSADILLMAGDIGSIYKYEQLEGFMRKVCTYFKTVLYIPGNHEYYIIKENNQRLSMTDINFKLRSLCNSIDNLHLLFNSSYIINNNNVSNDISDIDDRPICIVGCTLWSERLVSIPRYLVKIEGINNNYYDLLHRRDLNYIKKMIDYCKQNNYRLIVATHYCPTYDVLSTKWNSKRNKFQSMYTSNLDYLLDKNDVETWICGHTHCNFDLISNGGTRVVSNQKGKSKDKIYDFSKEFIIKL